MAGGEMSNAGEEVPSPSLGLVALNRLRKWSRHGNMLIGILEEIQPRTFGV